jgi:circadian clock protein KaiB
MPTGERVPIRLLLFLAPDTARSQLAARNITRAFQSFDERVFDLEIVDIFAQPARALRERVLVTPTLLAPDLGRRIVGDMSDAALLTYFLQSIA